MRYSLSIVSNCHLQQCYNYLLANGKRQKYDIVLSRFANLVSIVCQIITLVYTLDLQVLLVKTCAENPYTHNPQSASSPTSLQILLCCVFPGASERCFRSTGTMSFALGTCTKL